MFQSLKTTRKLNFSSVANTLKKKLMINSNVIKELNKTILNDRTINEMLGIVESMGGVDYLNQRAQESENIDQIMNRLKKENSRYLPDLEWLGEQKQKGTFCSIGEHREKVLGKGYPEWRFDKTNPVTLEISALNKFDWFIKQAKQALKKRELMPSRYILVRPMNEQERVGELLPLVGAMKMIGASFVETLDTKGTLPTAPDGGPANVHLGGPATLSGYFGGVGQPNNFALDWVREFLYYYSNYSVKEVLNINPGTVLLGYMLHKIGIDIRFKISVFMGNDNPASVLWTLLGAKMFSRSDNTTSLIGFNLSNAVNNDTIKSAGKIRESLGFNDCIRIEHHITETYGGIVRQPYDRTLEMPDIARHVPNVSAKHEGGTPSIEETREHPSNILEYFLPEQDREKLDPQLCINYLDKHNALNKTANLLTKNYLSFIAAPKLHKF
ncbi:hypothetical protein M0813_17473 [Anaeramoeba flamelloides]|uniref:Uncharacterized protein n=1 Tax=Anaeramoeba flamelloides TaxID=1746091 RepID=A0AAV7YVT1_9EUKA|nr:hypothetical protein M0812_22581 [Anaeramoeba flamelloides]KAJ6248507.1 hypothetical protein M0813_17473 [Anaeramoeba flamelloides]|eukprot:Anaeramoba_flamelloidesa1055255_1470.p1 GENE.a1055255_1470~~a1055255_1470.p1  ORF type:complete len:454 (+),score=111.02 a1055255_1470:42-1364(+)